MDEVKESAKAYTSGAVIGGVIGAGFALITRRKIMWWATIGVIAGGFIASKVSKSQKEGKKSVTKFKNYDSE